MEHPNLQGFSRTCRDLAWRSNRWTYGRALTNAEPRADLDPNHHAYCDSSQDCHTSFGAHGQTSDVQCYTRTPALLHAHSRAVVVLHIEGVDHWGCLVGAGI